MGGKEVRLRYTRRKCEGEKRKAAGFSWKKEEAKHRRNDRVKD